MCERLVLMSDPKIMAKEIQKFLEASQDIQVIYIASPPSELDLLFNMRNELKIINSEIQIFLSVELLQIMDENFENCEKYEADKFELLSLAEMEICSRSEIFLSSIGSSWSGNLNIERSMSGSHLRDQSNKFLMPDPDDYRIL